MSITKVQDLRVWQRATDLTAEVYKLTRKLPREELYVLTSQMRRAAVSICGSISEGFIRSTEKDRARFYNISRASAEELRCYFALLPKLGYAPATPALLDLLDAVCAMLHRLWETVHPRAL